MSKKVSLAVASGLLMALAFPNYGLAFLAWVALVPLIMATSGSSYRETFVLSLIAGAIFNLLTLAWLTTLSYWVGDIILLGWSALALYLSLYWGLFGLAVTFFRRKMPSVAYVAPAFLWVCLEYLQNHLLTGFGWTLVGYSQSFRPSIIQWAAWGGVYLVSFIIVLTNLLVAGFVESLTTRSRTWSYLWSAAAVAASCHLLGWLQIPVHSPQPDIKVGIAQGNFSLEEKWNPEYKFHMLYVYKALTASALDEGTELMVWPESAVPSSLRDENLNSLVDPLTEHSEAFLLVGANHYSIDGPPEGVRYFNSAFLLDSSGKILDRYDKMHLAPFGEYVPLRKIFPFLGKVVLQTADFSPGERPTIFAANEARIGVLICFEGVFPHLVRKFTTRGANLIVQMSNLGWFGRSAQPVQDLAIAVYRAVENRTTFIRATNTGISCFIDPWGRVSGRVTDSVDNDVFVRGLAVQEVSLLSRQSYYKAYGDVFVLLCVAFLAIVGALCYYKPRL